MNILEVLLFNFSNPSPTPPYFHQTLLDPTQSFLLAPDLPADIIHVFSITDSYTLQKLSGQADITVPKGHGPRHGVFYQPGGGNNTMYLYVVMETAYMVHGYSVTYNSDGTLSFTMIQDFQLPVPLNSTGAEIKLTVSHPTRHSLHIIKLTI
jgi:6-phosphogluconolactonase (cycloisomerase 2 family)